MKIFFDTEFTGLRKDTSLISIGLISENGQTFYAEMAGIKTDNLDDWIKENVLPGLRFGREYSSRPTVDLDHHAMKASSEQIRDDLTEWLSQFEKVEIWSDCLAYDWVLFCDLYGSALNIPENVYYIPFDLSTLLKIKGVDPDVNREEYSGITTGHKHNALHDAKVIRACYNRLMTADVYVEE